jgi:hypothetical protein
MITKEQAWEIGKAYFQKRNIVPYDIGIVPDAENFKDAKICIYNAPSESWVIKYPNPHCKGLCSSYAILISKDAGEIVYDGDAHDEG